MSSHLLFKVRHHQSLSGAEKRRKRKGGKPGGGPGLKGTSSAGHRNRGGVIQSHEGHKDKGYLQR